MSTFRIRVHLLGIALCLLALLVLVPCAPALSQERPYTLSQKSPERKAILDALRIPIQRELKRRVIFKVAKLQLQNGWAFFGGEPYQLNQKPMDYHGTKYQDLIDHEVFGGGVYALLRKRGGSWRVVDYAIGPSDVAWADWDKQYHAPPAIFK